MPERGAHPASMEALVEAAFESETLDPELLLRFERAPDSLSTQERDQVRAALARSADVRAQRELLRRLPPERLRTAGADPDTADECTDAVGPRSPHLPRRARSVLLIGALTATAAAAICVALLRPEVTPQGLDSLSPPARAIAPETPASSAASGQDASPRTAAAQGGSGGLALLVAADGAYTASLRPTLYWRLDGLAEVPAPVRARLELWVGDDEPRGSLELPVAAERPLQRIDFAALGLALEPNREHRLRLQVLDDSGQVAAEEARSVRHVPAAAPANDSASASPDLAALDALDRAIRDADARGELVALLVELGVASGAER